MPLGVSLTRLKERERIARWFGRGWSAQWPLKVKPLSWAHGWLNFLLRVAPRVSCGSPECG